MGICFLGYKEDIMETKQKKRIYCAIYTRKSTTEGLDQEFTTLDAQREAAENYIASQKSEGWVQLQEQYNDGGFTGANIERPALQKLLSDIKEHKVSCVVVYKVDRLSRSLMDFAQLLEFFEKHNVTFVSVTQHFNTNSSMGRLTLNILLSFAQFEREIISERTRDKMGAARKRGQWLGGRPALGYNLDKENKRILINEEEAALIREIFALYIKGNSLLDVARIINDKGYRTKHLSYKSGKVFGGKKYGVTHIQWIIRNVIYAGKVEYKGIIYEGQHEPIIDEATFKAAQAQLALNRRERKVTKNKECTGLLSRLLHCKACGAFMFHTYTLKKNLHKYRYYLCSSAQKRGYDTCPNKTLNAQSIEDAVIARLKTMFSGKDITEHPHKQELEALISPVWDTLYADKKRRILNTLLKEVDYRQDTKKLGITLNENGQRFEFDVDLKRVRLINKWDKEKELTKEPLIRSTLILAYQIQRLIDQGKIKHARNACNWLNLSPSRMDQVMNTLFLCPAIQEAILTDNNPSIQNFSEFTIRPILQEVNWNCQLDYWEKLTNNTL
jgi:DNA invertase Pin-like site-specific DNA recombinase